MLSVHAECSCWMFMLSVHAECSPPQDGGCACLATGCCGVLEVSSPASDISNINCSLCAPLCSLSPCINVWNVVCLPVLHVCICDICVVCVSEGDGDALTTTLQLRQEVRQAIIAGQIVPAMEQLSQHCPLVLQGHACSDEVPFHLRCQQYIEFIRSVSQGHAPHPHSTVGFAPHNHYHHKVQ